MKLFKSLREWWDEHPSGNTIRRAAVETKFVPVRDTKTGKIVPNKVQRVVLDTATIDAAYSQPDGDREAILKLAQVREEYDTTDLVALCNRVKDDVAFVTRKEAKKIRKHYKGVQKVADEQKKLVEEQSETPATPSTKNSGSKESSKATKPPKGVQSAPVAA